VDGVPIQPMTRGVPAGRSRGRILAVSTLVGTMTALVPLDRAHSAFRLFEVVTTRATLTARSIERRSTRLLTAANAPRSADSVSYRASSKSNTRRCR